MPGGGEMNWLIVSQMRSGSTFLGEWLQASGLPYFNELFTEEICRRSRIWPIDLDERVNEKVLSEVFRFEGAGFKMIYGQATPEVWARLILARFVKVIHIVRDDLLEQYCSIQYLQRVGVSVNRDGRCFGTDGKPAEPDSGFRFKLDPSRFIAWADETMSWRARIRWAFAAHEMIELDFKDCFRLESAHPVFNFLGLAGRKENKPSHKKTPRPRAREMVTNWGEVAEALIASGKYRGEIEKCI